MEGCAVGDLISTNRNLARRKKEGRFKIEFQYSETAAHGAGTKSRTALPSESALFCCRWFGYQGTYFYQDSAEVIPYNRPGSVRPSTLKNIAFDRGPAPLAIGTRLAHTTLRIARSGRAFFGLKRYRQESGFALLNLYRGGEGAALYRCSQAGLVWSCLTLKQGGAMAREGRVETTLGDFIVALTDAAGHQLHNDKMAYELVAYILTDLINSSEARKR